MRVALALIVALSVVQPALAADRVFRAGAAVVDITPQKFPVPSNGSMGPRFAQAAHDPLSVRSLVLDDGTTQIAFAVVDSCMIHRSTFDAAKEKAAKATGIPTEHMLFSATHTHSAVSVAGVFQSEPDAAYEKWLIDRIAEGVKQAHERLEPAEIGWAVGRNAAQVFNRRWRMRPGFDYADPFEKGTDRVRMNPPRGNGKLLEPAGPIDPQVPIVAVRSPQGRPIAVLANYSLHYVGGVPSNMLSADYFGEFARQFTRLIEAEKTGDDQSPFVAIMTNGTSGDINNINFYRPGKSQQPFEQIRLVATDVAESAAVAYRRVEFQEWVPLGMRETTITLGVRKADPAGLARARKLLAEAGDGPYRDRRHIYARESLLLADYPNEVEAKLQAIRIGDLGIVSSPCETFVETGIAIKKASPLKPTFVIELANGYNGYLPTPEHHALGGYETWRARSSYLAVDAEPKVRGTLLELLEEVAK